MRATFVTLVVATILMIASSLYMYGYDGLCTSDQMTDGLTLASFGVALFNLGIVYASVYALQTEHLPPVGEDGSSEQRAAGTDVRPGRHDTDARA